MNFKGQYGNQSIEDFIYFCVGPVDGQGERAVPLGRPVLLFLQQSHGAIGWKNGVLRIQSHSFNNSLIKRCDLLTLCV